MIIGLVLALMCQPAPADDPHVWLEEVDSPKALEWVKERNRKTLEVLEADPRFETFQNEALQLLEDKERIPYGQIQGDYVYNFWQDKDHVRGIWRRATREEYRQKEPAWETLLDIDELAKQDNENWVFQRVVLHQPERRRALVVLSRGGSDAAEWREFDLPSKTFVKDGFHLPAAKSRVVWFDANTLLVGTDFGAGSLTTSGYPRMLKVWQRDAPLNRAWPLFDVESSDVGVDLTSFVRPDGTIHVVERRISFFTADYFTVADDGSLIRVAIPRSAELVGAFGGSLLFLLREHSQASEEKTYSQGSLIAIEVGAQAQAAPAIEVWFKPTDRQAIQHVSAGKSLLNVALLDNVASRLVRLERSGQGSVRAIELPSDGNAGIVSADEESDDMLVSFTSFLTPPRLYEVPSGSDTPTAIKELPARFDAEGLITERREAKSADGTLIPYFVVRPKDLPFDGKAPTLLYAYGGFEIPMLPQYSPTIGKLWLNRGGVYVQACIRGGGEFGPAWHQAATQHNRQRAFDDFIAVAEDLIASEVTSSRHLGIMGGSNGGLLVGAAFTQRPNLFRAVVCQVPLLDMIRYSQLLAGASWIAEYGDPAKPETRASLMKYSPYHQVLPDRDYPEVLFMTSTKDDRVHPGHARKMVAKMIEQGHPVLYFENIEGGHSAAANLRQRARRTALEFTYLHRKLSDGK